MADLRTVWLVEGFDYEYSLYGIYDSLEAAKASWPDVEWREVPDGWVSEDVAIRRTDVQTLAESVPKRKG